MIIDSRKILARCPIYSIASITPFDPIVLSRMTYPKVHHMSKHMTLSQENDDRKQKSMM